MCLAILLHRQIDRFPVVLGANREESYARSSLPPHWFGDPALFGGRDQVAGGTWLGVNVQGLVVAVTNRHDRERVEYETGTNAPDRRSRGLLCVDALKLDNARAALEWTDCHLRRERYNPFNLLIVDRRDAFVVHGAYPHQIVELHPGLHVLSETDVDDVGNPRIGRAFDLFEGGFDESLTGTETVLKSVSAEHGDEASSQEWMCRHLIHGGTVSSAVLAVPDTGLEESRYWFAPGPPCRHPYDDRAAELRSGPAVH